MLDISGRFQTMTASHSGQGSRTGTIVVDESAPVVVSHWSVEMEDPKACVDRPEGVVVIVEVSDVLEVVAAGPVVVDTDPGEAELLELETPKTVVEDENDDAAMLVLDCNDVLVLLEFIVVFSETAVLLSGELVEEDETEVLVPDEVLNDVLVKLDERLSERLPTPRDEELLLELLSVRLDVDVPLAGTDIEACVELDDVVVRTVEDVERLDVEVLLLTTLRAVPFDVLFEL